MLELRDATAVSTDNTDGLRLTLADQSTLHLRPSGNAPEFRVYTEAADDLSATRLLRAALSRIAEKLA